MKQIESFFWGIIAAFGALFIELFITIPLDLSPKYFENISYENYLALPGIIIAAALIEETFKYLIITRKIRLISNSKSFILNCVLVGVGFFATEFTFMLFKDTNVIDNIADIIKILIIHIATAMAIGYLIITQKKLILLKCTALATIIHATFNLFIRNNSPLANYLIFFLLVLIVFMTFLNASLTPKNLQSEIK